MATKHHKSSVSLLLLAALAVGTLHGARAQTQPDKGLRGNLNVQATATRTSNPQPGTTSTSETVISATPTISLFSRGAHTSIDTVWQLNFVDYVNNTQPDRMLPIGKLAFGAFTEKGGPGVDLSVEATQVKATAAASQSITPDTRNSYTNTTYRVSPYFERDIDSQTRLVTRVERQALRSTQLSSSLAARPDSLSRYDLAQLNRRPTPLGYGLEWHQQKTQTSGQSSPSLDERIGKATALYAPIPELILGLSAGRGHNLIGTQTVNETTHGWQTQWRPTERSSFSAEVEDRHFGKSWKVDIGHRSPVLAFGINSERSVTTYASALGGRANNSSLRSLYDAMLTTRIPNPSERRQAVDDMIARRNLSTQGAQPIDTYDLSAQLRQTTSGRIALMGRRDILSVVGGMIRTAPLPTDSANSLATLTSASPGLNSKQYYLDTQVNHQLTPYSTMSAGLRWSRIRTLQTSGAPDVLSRDFSWRTSINTSLTPYTSATMGFNRLITHNPSTTSSDELAMFVGLGHRF
jgi:uncharacterized protein (PEP-CTERM system associated)